MGEEKGKPAQELDFGQVGKLINSIREAEREANRLLILSIDGIDALATYIENKTDQYGRSNHPGLFLDPEWKEFASLAKQAISHCKAIAWKAFEQKINFDLAHNNLKEYVKGIEYISGSDIEINGHEELAYDWKKKLVAAINEELRSFDAAIPHPETGEPCIIYAIASYDKNGRFTLEDRSTKKRSGSYRSLKELLPIHLVPDLPSKKKEQ